MVISGIYKYTNRTNNKVYIGQSVNILKRKWEHEHSPSRVSKFDKILNSIGPNEFDFCILEECPVSLLDERERFWIKEYNSTNDKYGYNILEGGTSKIGENNPQAKLSNIEISEIIKLLIENNLTNSEIGKLYRVSQSTIDQINRCQIWTHLHSYKNNIRRESNENSGRGENSKASKITEKIANSIIYDLERTNMSCPKIAQKNKVSINIVEDIKRCRTWKHLHNYQYNIRKEFQERTSNEQKLSWFAP